MTEIKQNAFGILIKKISQSEHACLKSKAYLFIKIPNVFCFISSA